MMYITDLLAYKIDGSRFALRELPLKYKEKMFVLIKLDYNEIKHTQYYDDYIKYWGPVKRKFFLDILKSKDYEEFKTYQKSTSLQTNSLPAK